MHIYPRRQKSRVKSFQRLLCSCLSVFPLDISEADAARITKLDTEPRVL